MAQKCCDPLCIPNVGLSAGEIPHMICVHDPEVFQILGTVFKSLINRLPIDAGAFHCNRITIVLREPYCHLQQFRLRCPEFCSDDLRRETLAAENTCLNKILVDIQSAAAIQQRFHMHLRKNDSCGGGCLKKRSLMHAVLPQFCVLKGSLVTF